MATIVLSAAGAAIGSGFGGTVLGLSGAVIGRAVGATLGRVMDQRLLGAGSEAVEVGRIDRFRLMGASEGAAVARVFGRVRVAGQVIWATRFQETRSTSGGGKGAPRPKTVDYSYSVSLAVALCEGVIAGVGRIWADGVEIAPTRLTMRVYRGGNQQLPDPKIEAVEGVGLAPAYRGIAYVVLEDLELAPFGNRVPQFGFEVIRHAQGSGTAEVTSQHEAVRAVALIPGTGEYALATQPVHFSDDPGVNESANVHSPAAQPDFPEALRQLDRELPNVGSVSLVVSWFGSDLRCAECEIKPKVEQTARDGEGMPWRVSGLERAGAETIVRDEGRPIYGGTPDDASVIQSIRAMRDAGKEVMFYPFILMEPWRENGLPDPWTGAADQPVLPWRGRITLSVAPGRDGSPDRSAGAEAEVAAFLGTAQPADFALEGERVLYAGPAEWRYRRFILHYAHLCKAAGGVDAFCIGSEMVALTQIRGAGDSFPAVAALRQLAAEVRAILGPEVKLSYAADWSEYFGYHTGGNVYFHLDPLWADPNIDFIGIDNYMPLSDWREGEAHLDAGWGSIHNLAYLKANVAGGEGFDWYYDSDEARAAQRRKPIEDGAYGEPWVFRYKDLKNWWSNLHFDRIDGLRQEMPTGWVPLSKPIRFTEYGCAAIEKGTNQPNKFLDPKSSESRLPYFSTGRRDDLIQMQYLRAFHEYWGDPAVNPASPYFAGRMVDMARAHVWTWDARPFPQFPNRIDLWGDGDNYPRGHWITGRSTNQPLAAVVGEICARAGVEALDVSDLRGVVRGYWLDDVQSARAALQPLMQVHGFDAMDLGGKLRFRMRDAKLDHRLEPGKMVVDPDLEGPVQRVRAADVETAGKVRLGFVGAEGDFQVRQAEAIFPDARAAGVSQSEVPMVLTAPEARTTAERWLAEARVARDGCRFALPPSTGFVDCGDVVDVEGLRYRVDKVERGEWQVLDATRVDPAVYLPSDAADERGVTRPFIAPMPVNPLFLELLMLTEEAVPHAPYVAVSARPWPGAVGVWSAPEDDGYALERSVERSATIGVTQSPLRRAQIGLWDRGEALELRLFGGRLETAGSVRVLNGANALAIGSGAARGWEILQFRAAELIAPYTYRVSQRLRGQLGTDVDMPEEWPAGSRVVLLDDQLVQLALSDGALGLERHYRIGAAALGYDDANVLHRVESFDGIGLRPYRPAHLNARRVGGGDLRVSWIRRTRVGGDSWASTEVPLAEAREAYQVQVWQGGQMLREDTVTAAVWTYTAAAQAADALAQGAVVRVAQLSDSFGPGGWAEADVPV